MERSTHRSCSAELSEASGDRTCRGHFCVSPSSSITISRFDVLQERQPIPSHVFSRLRQIDHLAVVEVDLNQYRASNHSDASHDALGGARDPWKRGFIGVLKNSTSKDRKLFRWRVVDRRIFPGSGDLGIPEYRAIEVLPKTSL